jgi:ribonuclease PH
MSVRTGLARKDGRAATQLRPKELRTSTLTQFDGSSWFSQGATTVVAAVNGPMAAKADQEDFRRCVFEVSVARVSSPPTAGGASRALVQVDRLEREENDSELEQYILQCLRLLVLADELPRCVVQVTVNIIKDDGSIFAAAVNAVMCALLDAGIPCRTTVAAVSLLAISPPPGAKNIGVLLDPTHDEEEMMGGSDIGASSGTAQLVAQSTFVFALPQSGGGLVASKTRLPQHLLPGSAVRGLNMKELVYLETVGERAAKVMFDFFRNCSAPTPQEETEVAL